MGITGELYQLFENYLSGRLQRVALNGQTSSWRPVLAGVSQGSILGPLLLFIHINDLPDELKSNVKLFANNTSLFSIVKDENEKLLNFNFMAPFYGWGSTAARLQPLRGGSLLFTI